MARMDELPRGAALHIRRKEAAMTAMVLVFALAIGGAILMWRADR